VRQKSLLQLELADGTPVLHLPVWAPSTLSAILLQLAVWTTHTLHTVVLHIAVRATFAHPAVPFQLAVLTTRTLPTVILQPAVGATTCTNFATPLQPAVLTSGAEGAT